MTPKLRLGLEVLAVLAVLVLAVEYHRAEMARATAEAGQQARDAANKASQQQINDLSGQIKQIQQDNASQVLALTKTVASLKTPQQQVAWSQDQLVQAIKGITISVNPKTGEAEATIPAASIPSLPAVIEKCQACSLNLDATSKQLSYSQEQQKLLAGQLVNMTTERDQWKTAAKGGSWLKRVGKAAEYLLIGGAIGFAAAKR